MSTSGRSVCLSKFPVQTKCNFTKSCMTKYSFKVQVKLMDFYVIEFQKVDWYDNRLQSTTNLWETTTCQVLVK